MAKKSQAAPKNFEEALDELERILSEIESGEVGLEESLAKYERGQFLIQHCRQILGKAEKQIETLNGNASESDAEAAASEERSETESPEV
ncbi:MAG TPA: exodeoxyribonuclease VII small subunit [Tepidisphaeraceae bacterium]